MRVFILEDNGSRVVKFKRELIGNRVDHAETLPAGREMIRDNEYDLIFLDHDLGGMEMVDSSEEDTGYHLAVLIAADDRNSGTPCIVHSCNPAGADNIVSVLPHAVKVPFPSLNIAEAVRWAGKEREWTTGTGNWTDRSSSCCPD